MNIVVASTNPVKIEAVRRGFAAMFPGESVEARGVSVPSGVSDQPMTDAETFQGAYNRALNARHHAPDAAYWAGVEGGCDQQRGDLLAFAWVVVLSKDGIGSSRTATFTLPNEIAVLVRQGVELGVADDIVFGRSNSKQANGAVGILTADAIDRTRYYEHAVILALVPFKNPALTFGEKSSG
ncbi:MAG: inosine/xanthosine triphosphatase [Chloroflexi bacterium]|nr:inosine/xanthosine triphosphatase [Chloroflexota bacterium]